MDKPTRYKPEMPQDELEHTLNLLRRVNMAFLQEKISQETWLQATEALAPGIRKFRQASQPMGSSPTGKSINHVYGGMSVDIRYTLICICVLCFTLFAEISLWLLIAVLLVFLAGQQYRNKP